MFTIAFSYKLRWKLAVCACVHGEPRHGKTLSFGLMAGLNADSKGKSTDILHKSN